MSNPVDSQHALARSTRRSTLRYRIGRLQKLTWDDLRQTPSAPGLGYSFKYFEQVEGDVFLPVGMTPVRVTVRLVPQSGAAVEQSFTWAEATGENGATAAAK